MECPRLHFDKVYERYHNQIHLHGHVLLLERYRWYVHGFQRHEPTALQKEYTILLLQKG